MINFYLITIDADVGAGEQRDVGEQRDADASEQRDGGEQRDANAGEQRDGGEVSRGMLMLVSREMVVVKREMLVIVRRKRKLTVMSGLQISLV